MKDTQGAAESLMRESRALYEQASKYREELKSMQAGDQSKEELERLVRDLLERSKSMSETAKQMLAS
jgi:signal transduction histidine kinase